MARSRSYHCCRIPGTHFYRSPNRRRIESEEKGVSEIRVMERGGAQKAANRNHPIWLKWGPLSPERGVKPYSSPLKDRFLSWFLTQEGRAKERGGRLTRFFGLLLSLEENHWRTRASSFHHCQSYGFLSEMEISRWDIMILGRKIGWITLGLDVNWILDLNDITDRSQRDFRVIYMLHRMWVIKFRPNVINLCAWRNRVRNDQILIEYREVTSDYSVQ